MTTLAAFSKVAALPINQTVVTTTFDLSIFEHDIKVGKDGEQLPVALNTQHNLGISENRWRRVGMGSLKFIVNGFSLLD